VRSGGCDHLFLEGVRIMFNHSISQVFATDDNQKFLSKSSFVGRTHISFEGGIAANTDNQEIDFGFQLNNAGGFNQIQSLLFFCTSALTIKTNSSSSPTQTIALSAGVALIWNIGSQTSCPITADVTKLFLSNDTPSGARVEMRVLLQ